MRQQNKTGMDIPLFITLTRNYIVLYNARKKRSRENTYLHSDKTILQYSEKAEYFTYFLLNKVF